MNHDSGFDAVVAELDHLTREQPAGSLLPSTRELQKRFRVSALTVQRALALLASRGRLVTRPGRGSYTAACEPATGGGDLSWQTLALGFRPELPADLESLLAPTSPGLLPLASAFLDETLQPRGLLGAAAARAARLPHGWARPPAEGLDELRGYFAAEAGPGHRADNVLVTSGGQAALTAVCRYLAAPGEPIVVESPTYIGALAAARAAGLLTIPVLADEHGVLPDALATALRRSGARLVYLQPRHANPTGATLAADRRTAVVDAVARAGAFLIEDDWVRDLDFDQPSPPPLASHDEDGRVIHIRSLTKPVAAGLRVAALVARGPALTRLRRGHLADDLFVAPLLQHTALGVLTAPGWPRHLAALRRALRQRRDALLASLAIHLPRCPTPHKPDGGVHLWLRLPDDADDAATTVTARQHGLVVSPGRSYFPAEPPAPYLRLSYAAADPLALQQAVALLSQAITHPA